MFALAALPGGVAFLPHIDVPYFYSKYECYPTSQKYTVAFPDVLVLNDYRQQEMRKTK